MSLFFAIDLDKVLADKDTPPPYQLAGLTITEYSRLSTRQRHALLKKFKPEWVITGFKAFILNVKTRYKVWEHQPKGGYLFSAWCRHNAETSTFQGPPMSWFDPPEWKLKKRTPVDF